MHLTIKKHSLDPRPSYPLQILATQYSLQSHQDGYTLIFMHSLGMHKEIWEVTISRFLHLCARNPASPKIRDVFSIESPNCGESSIINQSDIDKLYGDNWPPTEYARSTHAFLTAGPSRGAKIDFSRRKLVAIGHSMGATALCFIPDFTPTINFHSIISMEPGLSIKDLPETIFSSQLLTTWTWLRRDVWIDREAARKDLARSPVFKTWDPRILDLYTRHGLREHPAAQHAPPFTFNGVTLCLTKTREANFYRSEQLVVDAMDAYTALTKQVPVHLIFGAVPDVGHPELQKILSDSEAGRTPASVNYVEEAGHLLVQQKPDSVADTLHSLLSRPPAKL